MLVCALVCVHLCVALYDFVIELCFLWFPVPEVGFAVKSCSCCGHQSMGGVPCVGVWSAYLC